MDYMGATGSSEQQAERGLGEGLRPSSTPCPFLERCLECLKQCRASQGGRQLIRTSPRRAVLVQVKLAERWGAAWPLCQGWNCRL